MSGQMIRVLPKTSYNFSNLAANQSAGDSITLALAIEASQWREAVLEVRLHDVTWPASSGAKIEVQFAPVAPTDEEPGTVFADVAAAQIVTLTEGTDTAPTLKTAALSDFGGWLMIAFSPHAGSQTGTFTFAISIDLSLKS